MTDTKREAPASPEKRAVGDRGDADRGLSPRSTHRQAPLLQRLQVGPACDERDVVSAFREERPVISADPTRSDHCESHARSLRVL